MRDGMRIGSPDSLPLPKAQVSGNIPFSSSDQFPQGEIPSPPLPSPASPYPRGQQCHLSSKS